MLVIRNKTGTTPGILTLIDTGANMPVWCDSVESLQFTFPGARYSGYKAKLRGFGNPIYAPIWVIPEFVLSDGKDYVAFPQLKVMVNGLSASFKMILSFTMLDHAEITYKSTRDDDNTFIRDITINYEQKCVLTKTMTDEEGAPDHIVALAQSLIRHTRTLNELLSDNDLFLKASDHNINVVDLYCTLPTIIEDTTDMTDEEILDKVASALVVSGS